MNALHRSTRFLSAAGVAASALLGATACLPASADIQGSGYPETVVLHDLDFDAVEVGDAFDVDVVIADGPPTIEVTVDDNLVEHLDVDVRGGRLTIGLHDGRTYDVDVEPRAIVTTPALERLDVTGASTATVTRLVAADFVLGVSGASDVHLTGRVDTMTIDASGASNLDVDGRAGYVDIAASGASHVDLDDLAADSGLVDISGASFVRLGTIESVGGELSGASTLAAAPTSDVDVRTAGGSSVTLR